MYFSLKTVTFKRNTDLPCACFKSARSLSKLYHNGFNSNDRNSFVSSSKAILTLSCYTEKKVRYIFIIVSGESVCKSDMSSNIKTSQNGKNRRESLCDGFFSSLFSVINSGKFWRCIRWCHKGRTVLITSPTLFEREVLQTKEWKLQQDINDFTNFVALLKQLGFKPVTNQRQSKVQKFQHPQFTKDCGGILTEATKRDETQRKRKIPENENAECSAACSTKEKRNPAQKSKRQRIFNFELRDENATTAEKRNRKAGNSSEISTPVKKQKATVISSAPVDKETPSQMRRNYSAEEMTVAQALLSLSTPVVFANYKAAELMAAQCLVDLSKFCVAPRRRTVQELEAAQTLLELANSAKV